MGAKRRPAPVVSAAVAAAAAAVERDPRWLAVRARDATADGFVYAVKTTGVFCRPSCAARPARPENVAFFDEPRAHDAARAAGFRPCRRCQPDAPPSAERRAALIGALCRFIEEAVAGDDRAPTLDQLADRAGMSPFYLHRLFKEVTGVTPKAYAAARRGARVRSALTGASTRNPPSCSA
jgi:AraC family transcriptional regulator of adaptative response/methylated-DNA-[protein]-cysteine methyltransferase